METGIGCSLFCADLVAHRGTANRKPQTASASQRHDSGHRQATVGGGRRMTPLHNRIRPRRGVSRFDSNDEEGAKEGENRFSTQMRRLMSSQPRETLREERHTSCHHAPTSWDGAESPIEFFLVCGFVEFPVRICMCLPYSRRLK